MKNTILRSITAIAALAGSLSALDLGGFIHFIPGEYAAIAGAVALGALAIKEGAIVMGDILDNGKRDGSFKG